MDGTGGAREAEELFRAFFDSAPIGQAKRASTLAAEVALIDAARSAISKEAFEDALRLVGRYRRDFP